MEGCIPEYAYNGHDRPPSGSTISGVAAHQFHMNALWLMGKSNRLPLHNFLYAVRAEHGLSMTLLPYALWYALMMWEGVTLLQSHLV